MYPYGLLRIQDLSSLQLRFRSPTLVFQLRIAPFATLRFAHVALARYKTKDKKMLREEQTLPEHIFCLCFATLVVRADYLLLNCGARRAAFKPYFFLSFILGSLVRKPAFLSVGLNSASTLRSALAIPCLMAPA